MRHNVDLFVRCGDENEMLEGIEIKGVATNELVEGYCASEKALRDL
jgi:hypothetical protein